MSVVYPFTAIVGQERMRRALVLNAVNPRIGGVLIRGERGTAKSTAARALAALLPEVRVVADCRFDCDPEPADHLVHRVPRARRLRRGAAGRDAPHVVRRPARLGHRGPRRRHARHRGGHQARRAALRARRAGGRQPRPAVHRRGQPARRPRRRPAARLGGPGHEHRRARGHLLRPPGPLHPGRHDEPRGRRPAPAAARPLRPVGRHPRASPTLADRVAIMERNLAFEADPEGFRASLAAAGAGALAADRAPPASWSIASPTTSATCSPSPP